MRKLLKRHKPSVKYDKAGIVPPRTLSAWSLHLPSYCGVLNKSYPRNQK